LTGELALLVDQGCGVAFLLRKINLDSGLSAQKAALDDRSCSLGLRPPPAPPRLEDGSHPVEHCLGEHYGHPIVAVLIQAAAGQSR
jgi:hypothetical protein